MPKKKKTVKIKIAGTNVSSINQVINEIKELVKTYAVAISVVPLPTKHIIIPVKKAPDGEGTATWDKWEMRIHKRLLLLEPNEHLLRRLMRMEVPSDVHLKLNIKEVE